MYCCFCIFNFLINGESQLTPLVLLLTATIFIYSIIIAWFKDIPDMEGDRRYNINTFSIRFGADRMFLLGNVLISATFFALIIFAILNPILVNMPLMVISHLLFFVALIWFSRKTKINQPLSMSKYYQFVWVLFFAEYVIFGLSQLG